MSSRYHFTRHYTREEAKQLLPQVKEWLETLGRLDKRLQPAADQIEQLIAGGHDRGGARVESYLKLQAEFMAVLGEFDRREIQVKDLHRGLVDFPSILQGREVFLCWEQGEEDIEFWHDLDAGYAGRERL